MKIAVVGIGYVGLVSAACFSNLGAEVYCVDIDTDKIKQLKDGIIPIYEPGLEPLVARGLESHRLIFSNSLREVLPNVEIVFIAVGTPPDEDGSADLTHVLEVAHEIGKYLTHYCLVVDKSTVPVGTSKMVKSAIKEELDRRHVDIEFDVASNPEFLKEGNAVDDFMKPDRVVVGLDSERAKILMTRLYKPILLNNFRVIFMDIASAEMSKYTANAMLATRISFMNEIAALCEVVGADIHEVRKAIGADTRIGSNFLYAGCGYGGSCFPKDVKALIHTAKSHNLDMKILQQVEIVNDKQKHILFDKLSAYYNHNLKGKKIAIWGLSFKPGTDDMREAPSLVLIDALLKAGCIVSAYDPIAINEAKRRLGNSIYFAKDIYDAVLEADAVIHVTEWKEFRIPSWDVIYRLMRKPLLIDGRNVFNKIELQEYKIDYICIGRSGTLT